jgi:hypothetical protein
MLRELARSYLTIVKDVSRVMSWLKAIYRSCPIGDVNPSCSLFGNGWYVPTADNPVDSTLTTRPGFVEFYTVQHKKVTATW